MPEVKVVIPKDQIGTLKIPEPMVRAIKQDIARRLNGISLAQAID